MIHQLAKVQTIEAQLSQADQARRQGRSQPRPLVSALAKHRTRVHDLSTVLTPGRSGGRSSAAKRAFSDESKLAALTPQGPRGQQSPRPSQTPTPCHVARMRQHRIAYKTGTKPTVQIQTDKKYVRSYPLWDGIYDKGLNTEAVQTS